MFTKNRSKRSYLAILSVLFVVVTVAALAIPRPRVTATENIESRNGSLPVFSAAKTHFAIRLYGE